MGQLNKHGMSGILRGLALFGLALKLCFPPGYMPGSVSQGHWIVVCPQGLPAGALADANHHHGDDHPNDPTQQLGGDCPLGSQLSANGFVLPTALPVFGVAQQPRFIPNQTIQFIQHHRRYQSRGPPAVSQ